MKKYLLILALISASVAVSSAQDRLYKNKSQEPLECKIMEIGDDVVRYTLPNTYDKEVVFAVDRNKIRMVVFESGQVMEFKNSLLDPENYAGQNKNLIKVDFLSPLTGSLKLSYERSVKPGQSFEVGAGWIGGGINYDNQQGFIVSGGYKFMLAPSYYLRGQRYAHLLKGSYIKPEITFTSYSYDGPQYAVDYYPGTDIAYYPTDNRKNDMTMTVMLVLGKQWVLADRVAFDIYGGLGYGFDFNKNGDSAYHFSHMGGGNGNGTYFAFTAGFKIGILFGRK